MYDQITNEIETWVEESLNYRTVAPEVFTPEFGAMWSIATSVQPSTISQYFNLLDDFKEVYWQPTTSIEDWYVFPREAIIWSSGGNPLVRVMQPREQEVPRIRISCTRLTPFEKSIQDERRRDWGEVLPW